MSLIMIIAVIIAYFIKGMCGFANTLVFSSIMSFKENNINISPLELIVGYISNIVIVFKERKTLDIKIWLPLSVYVIAGSIPGVFLLKNGNMQSIKLLFGIIVVIIGLEMFLREYQTKKYKQYKIFLIMIGVVSGVLCGLFGIGALMAAYVSRTTSDNSSFKSNMCVVFMIENTFRIALYSMTGIITRQIVGQALMLIPFMVVGLALGMKSSKILDEKIVKKAVIILLVLSGASLIIMNL